MSQENSQAEVLQIFKKNPNILENVLFNFLIPFSFPDFWFTGENTLGLFALSEANLF